MQKEKKPNEPLANEPHTFVYKLENMTVELPILGPEATKARQKINDLAREVYMQTGTLDDVRLREAEEAFERDFSFFPEEKLEDKHNTEK